MSLNHAQKRAVAHREGPCMVLAGPGSGKTLTIAKRIEYLITKYRVRPEEILVITFTKYAAKEMKERFCSLYGCGNTAVTFGTFHGIYYGILKWAYGLNQSNLLSDEEKYILIREAATKLSWEELKGAGEEKEYLQELAAEIGNIKNNCRDIRTYESQKYGTERFRELYRNYERMKQELRKIDFEDMLIKCRALFLHRPDILKKWQEKFQYILVDEFQDINQAQDDVVRMLAAPQNNLFVVGDDDQSVYGFRGAKPGIMMQFQKDYPQADRILLDINYRSSGHIVNGALRVIGNNKMRFDKAICSSREAGDSVHIQEVQDPAEEAEYVADQIKVAAQKGIPYSEMAVLYRTVADARAVSEALSKQQIPFTMKERIQNLYDHFIAADLLSYLHLAQKDWKRAYFLQVANKPNRYLSRDSMEGEPVTYESMRNFYCDKDWMMDRIDQWEWDMKMIRDKTPYAAVQYIRKNIGYEEYLKEYAASRQLSFEELKLVLEEIHSQAKAYRTAQEWFAHIEEYRETLRRLQMRENQRKPDGVAMMTMHGAKGLEFEQVFLIHANEGCTPYKKAKTAEEIEEERRLFYVAMTRAKQKLIISYAKEKNGKDLSPSRFAEELLFV